jgi:hypothetical protein
MNNIPYQFILFLIVFVILAIIFISSVYYNNDEDTTVKNLSKNVIKNKSVNQISFIKPEINNNCYILNISSSKENIGYSLSGIFTNSCISVYKNGERITNYICNGSKNIVFSCNENILTPLYRLSKNKSMTIPLEKDQSYKIVTDYIKDVKMQQYTVNLDIDFVPIPQNYPIITAYNEYDIDLEVKKSYENAERQYFSNYKSPSEWYFYKNGARFVLAMVKNRGNYNIILNSENEELIEYNTSSEPIEIIFRELENPNIKLINLDYIAVKKDINTEYIDLVTSPNYLLQKFLYGDKYKDINYSMYISNKCMIYKI